MRRSLLFMALGLLGGFAVSAWWSSGTSDVERRADTPMPDARVVELERSLRAEVAALRREIDALRDDVATLGAAAPEGFTTQVGDAPAAAARDDAEPVASTSSDAEAAPDDFPVPPRQRFRLRSGEGRIDALTEAGFSLDRAQQIERRVEELRVAAMQARYEAARNGAPANTPGGEFFNMSASLRSELGDADYERYLTAMGQPTRVDVFSVLASSAAEQAGLEPGDQIVAYAGERVFDVRELNSAVLVGEPGEPVVVDIVRAGQPMQLVLPRGPLGISGGFGRRQRGQ